MDDKLNELLRAGKTEQEQRQEQPETEIKREPVAYVEKDTTTGEYTKRLEYITRPVAKQPVKKLSAFGQGMILNHGKHGEIDSRFEEIRQFVPILSSSVGTGGFEPSTSCSQSTRASRTALHPD